LENILTNRRRLMEAHTLVLTPWYAPHKIIPWQRSMEYLVTDKVDVLVEYEGPEFLVCSARLALQLPSVVRLRKAVHGYKKGVKFSRVNVFTRDGFRCCYCGAERPARDLNYDHVIPRAQGGRTVWENVVTACAGPRGCNSRKGNRTPGQAGMTLRKAPVKPKVLPMTVPSWPIDKMPEAWRPYLGVQSSGWATGAAKEIELVAG
jgi:5-methylcytosine-specific restriction endonuclease McrA